MSYTPQGEIPQTILGTPTFEVQVYIFKKPPNAIRGRDSVVEPLLSVHEFMDSSSAL